MEIIRTQTPEVSVTIQKELKTMKFPILREIEKINT